MNDTPATTADPITPHRLFRAFALAEAVTWTLLILGMIGKYALHLGDWPVSVGGGLHGLVFLAYCVSVVMVWIDARWPAREGLLGLVSAVIPYATIAFERRALRYDRLPHHWRLRSAGAADDATSRLGTVVERVLALFLRRPAVSTIIVVALVVALYLFLLWLGPPVQVSGE